MYNYFCCQLSIIIVVQYSSFFIINKNEFSFFFFIMDYSIAVHNPKFQSMF